MSPWGAQFFEVCLCCVLSGAVGNVVTLLIREVADCEGSDQSCCRDCRRPSASSNNCSNVIRSGCNVCYGAEMRWHDDDLLLRWSRSMRSRHRVAWTQLQMFWRAAVFRPWLRSTRSTYCVCAQSLMTPLMWSEADKLDVKVTPRILSQFSRVGLMSVSVCGVVILSLPSCCRRRWPLEFWICLVRDYFSSPMLQRFLVKQRGSGSWRHECMYRQQRVGGISYCQRVLHYYLRSP